MPVTDIRKIQSNVLDNLVFLDIETTGLDPSKGAKIVEIAMLKIKDGQEYKFETLVNPECEIPAESSKIHLIYDNMVAASPNFKDITKDILNFIGDSTVVCHNAMFDLTFVHKEFFESGIELKNIFYIDTLKLARSYFNFESNVLGNIAAAVGVDVNIKHRAMADVLTMYSVSKYLFKNMYRKGVDTIQAEEYKYKT